MPSRKKHQITQPSIVQAITNRIAALNLPQFGTPRTLVASALLSVTIAGSLCADLNAQESPLERLQNRSADSRWKDAAAKWLQVGEPKNIIKQLPGRAPEEAKADHTERAAEAEEVAAQPKNLDTEFDFDTSFTLFEPFPNRVKSKPGTTTEPTHSKVESQAKPFPIPSTSVASPAIVTTVVPAPVDVTATQEPPLVKNPKQKFEVPAEPQRIAMLAQIPPAPESDESLPKLRSISEIRPYHDYVPVRKAKPGSEAIKPVNAEGPKYLPLPAAGSLASNSPQTYYHWMASNLTHDPLYFEDVSLERYGHTYPLQPFVSISKFGLQVIGLPYQMALNPVDCEQYALGYYRPGDCAPFLRYRIPGNKKAAATAAGVYTGLIFLIP